ncbi:MAG: PhzF family phenazine biosynthesis protein [Ferrovum sp.]|jgi:PhzF family phenazine biosynthesis protein|nr:PhzF family phenazine biosynthesis protein [Ferrovum sp.]
MNLEIFQVDAFASRPFEGNPAAVCPLEHWLDDELLQSIAAENNLSETAFFVPSKDEFELRWFTPVREVTLCGHATLATAHVMFEHLGYPGPLLVFDTLNVNDVHLGLLSNGLEGVHEGVVWSMRQVNSRRRNYSMRSFSS